MLRVACLMKQVPVPSEMRMGADGLMDRTTAKSIINVDCSFGLEQGLHIKDQVPNAELCVVSMGPPSFEQSLKKAISMGFDRALILSDRRLGGSDTFATGHALATFLKKLGFSKESKEPFILFAGRQTTDGDTAHVPSQVAEGLGIPQVTFAQKVEYKGDHLIVERIIEGGSQTVKVPIPCLISMAPTGTPARRPSLKGAIKASGTKIEMFTIDQIGLPVSEAGLDGSPTIVAKTVNMEKTRAEIKMIQGENPKELADHLIQTLEAKS